MIGWMVAIIMPSLGWLVGHILSGQPGFRPTMGTLPLVGALAPAGLQRWCGRTPLEQVLGWGLGFLGWAAAAIGHDGEFLAATFLGGAAWGLVLGASKLGEVSTTSPQATPAVKAAPSDPPRMPPPARETPPLPPRRTAPAGDVSEEDLGFRLALRCPTCGAELAVPVYHHMTRCEFCASEHVVHGRGEVIRAVIPDAVTSLGAAHAAVVKYLRRLHFQKLYQQRVRPLVEQHQAQLEQNGVPFPIEVATSPIVAAMEAQVEWEADRYAQRIAPRLRVTSWKGFLAPYWHRMGTLYQVAFGRDAEGSKRMEFVVATLEGSAPANPTPLPAMGKLSYLRALHPLAGSPEGSLPALPASLGQEQIEHKALQPSERRIDLSITPIAQRGAFVPEAVALVYRPWHLVTAELDGSTHGLLVDGGAADVVGEATFASLDAEPLPPPGEEELRLTPSRCPECGGDFSFAVDTVAHLCPNCYRLLDLAGGRWQAVRYAREEPSPGAWLVPFWRFPLRLRGASGEVVIDLPHLTDGIDGTFDQIGERPQVPQFFYVPAFRARVSKVGVRLYRQLWPLLQHPRSLSRERFTPAAAPRQVVAVTLPAEEAREFARVYLALAFGPRDLARAEIKRVRASFLDAGLEGEPLLTFLNLPSELMQPFRGLFGRARPRAIEVIEGQGR